MKGSGELQWIVDSEGAVHEAAWSMFQLNPQSRVAADVGGPAVGEQTLFVHRGGQ